MGHIAKVRPSGKKFKKQGLQRKRYVSLYNSKDKDDPIIIDERWLM